MKIWEYDFRWKYEMCVDFHGLHIAHIFDNNLRNEHRWEAEGLKGKSNMATKIIAGCCPGI